MAQAAVFESREAVYAERVSQRAQATPFLKWVGGKARLLPQLLPLLPADHERLRHVEPFVGGGAMFFALQPRVALLGDINLELCGAYLTVRDDLDSLLAALRPLAEAHSPAQFYNVRCCYNTAAPCLPVHRAAMFIYLNKTCFNGLHRVNARGEFNVPIGRYRNPRILDEHRLRSASAALAGASVRCATFESLLCECARGDFVYLDPPYAPASRTANFTHYTRDGFDDNRQRDLARWVAELDRRGCKFMLSNSDVAATRDLYRGFRIDVVRAPRSINSNPRLRGMTRELIIRNY